MDQRRDATDVGGTSNTSNMRSTISPLEELAAASEHLRALQRQASGGAWVGGDWNEAPGWEHQQVVACEDGDGDVTDYIDTLDVQLIIALHRTIDPQIAVLDAAHSSVLSWLDPAGPLGYEPQDGNRPPGAAVDAALALARSITGDLRG